MLDSSQVRTGLNSCYHYSRISTVLSVQKALAKAGIEFLAADQKGEGVRLKSPKF